MVGLKLILHLFWTEPRLTHIGHHEGHWESINLEFLEHLWIPNIYVYNIDHAHDHRVTDIFAGKGQARLSLYTTLLGEFEDKSESRYDVTVVYVRPNIEFCCPTCYDDVLGCTALNLLLDL